MNPNLVEALKHEAAQYTFDNFAKIQPRTDRHYEYEEDYRRWRRKVEELIGREFGPEDLPQKLLAKALGFQDINRGDTIAPRDFDRARDLMVQALDMALRGQTRPATVSSLKPVGREEAGGSREAPTDATAVTSPPISAETPPAAMGGAPSTLIYINDTSNALAKDTVVLVEEMLQLLNITGVLAQGDDLFTPDSQALPQGVLGHWGAVVCVTGHGPGQLIAEDQLISVGAVCALYRHRTLLLWDQRLPVPTPLLGIPRIGLTAKPLDLAEGMEIMTHLKAFGSPETGAS